MKHFSIIFPTRNRVSKLLDCLKSILNTTKEHGYIEVLVGYDSDDEYTKAILPILEKEFELINLVMFEFGRKDNLHAYYNEMYEYSSGQNLITFNDDARIETYGWDSEIWSATDDYRKQHPDGIYYCFVEDGLTEQRHGNYCCFPVISRDVVNVLGCLQDERFNGGGADIFLGNVMHELDRVIDLRNVRFDHISHHNYPNIPKDDTYINMHRRFCIQPGQVQHSTKDYIPELTALRKYINDFRNSSNSH